MAKLKLNDLVFVSHSPQKYCEYCDLLGIKDLRQSDVKVIESQNLTPHTLVEEKIKHIRAILPTTPFFVEHTGLMIEAWKGLPGGLINVFMETVGNDGICKMMKGFADEERLAKAQVVIGYYHPDHGPNYFEGEVGGRIALTPLGKNNFGWDPIFIPEGSTKTYAQMSQKLKNETSMRRIAAQKFVHFIKLHFEI